MDSISLNEITSSQVLWKDIWWMNLIVIATLGIPAGLVLHALIVRVMSIKRNESDVSGVRTLENNAKAGKPTTGHNSKLRGPKLSETTKPNVHSKTHTAPEEHFYDIKHHGVNFFNDETAVSTREPRPRMHSTVTKNSLNSLVRKRMLLEPLIEPPAFPKMQEPQSSGDAVHDYSSQSESIFSRINRRRDCKLSTVDEEERGRNGTKSSNPYGLETKQWFLRLEKSHCAYRHMADTPKSSGVESCHDCQNGCTPSESCFLHAGVQAVDQPCVSPQCECSHSTNRFKERLCHTDMECREIPTEVENDNGQRCIGEEEFFDENYEDMESIASGSQEPVTEDFERRSESLVIIDGK